MKNEKDKARLPLPLHVFMSEEQFSSVTASQHKETATHSSVLAWRIPGTGEPGGLLSIGSHRVGHDWSDLAAAAAERKVEYKGKWEDNKWNKVLDRTGEEGVKKTSEGITKSPETSTFVFFQLHKLL